MIKIFKNVSLILGLLGVLLAAAGFGLISSREAVGLFVISLVLVICLGSIKEDLSSALKEEITPIKKDVNKITNRLDRIEGLLNTLKEIVSNLKKTVGILKHNVKVICDSLIKSPIKFDTEKLKEYSPLGLTEKGKKYLEEISFVEIFNKHRQDFFNFIDSEQPKAKYDVETSAMKSLLVLIDKEYCNPLKTYLYEHPKEENLRGMAQIAGVYIREKYLEKHPEITE